MMSKQSVYNDGFTKAFLEEGYEITPESVKYILRGYSDIKDINDEYCFSLSCTNGEGYYIKPEDNIEDILLLNLLQSIGIPFETDITSENEVMYVFRNCNLFDFLHKVFSEDLVFDNYSKDLFQDFLYEWDNYVPSLDFQYTLNAEGAVPPTKGRFSDTGYDLTVISEKKRIGNTVIYDTGVSVKPAYGFYFDVVPRSSISKMGYMQTNSVGIIDSAYRGNIMIALTKMDDSVPDLELPCRIGQLIPRKLHLVNMVSVDSLDSTHRGSDGGICR